MSQIFLETRMFRLSDGEEIMTLVFIVLKPDLSQLAGCGHTDRDIRRTRLSQPFSQYPAKSWELLPPDVRFYVYNAHCTNSISSGALPKTPLGELTALLQTP